MTFNPKWIKSNEVVKRDGTNTLTDNWNVGDKKKIITDEIRAQDVDGIVFSDQTGVIALHVDSDGAGIALNQGIYVNEISTDTGLLGASDKALVTQRAVKLYVDTNVFSGSSEIIIADPKTSDFNSIKNTLQPIDTTSNVVTVTFPGSPEIGEMHYFLDYSGTFEINNAVFDGNGNRIMGLLENFNADKNYISLNFIYVDAIQGWRMVSGVVSRVGLVTLSTEQTLSNKTLESSNYTQIEDATSGSGTYTFDYSQGDMQQITATGDITIAFSNFPTGKVASFIIDAVNWGDYTITHPAGLVFAGGAAPTYTSGGTDRLLVIKDKDDVYSLFIIGQAIGVV